MLRFAFLALSLALAFPAYAQDSRDRAEWNPPHRYDFPYKGKLLELRLPRDQVLAACGQLFDQMKVDSEVTRGCAVRPVDGTCLIVMIDEPYKSTTPEAVRRHEIGHCNGWPGDHPQD